MHRRLALASRLDSPLTTRRVLRPVSRPVALVYRGDATLPGCAESAAALLRASRWNFDVRYVGPREETALTPQALDRAGLYVQPGGGELKPAWRRMRRHSDDIRRYVAGGGRYLGICLGAYLAGATPGFDLLPGDTDQYATTRGADVPHTHATVVDVAWRGRALPLYFQDGPVFAVGRHAAGLEIIASYANGQVAALTAPYGAGRVGVVGPHPEADRTWFADSGIPQPARSGIAAGLDLIDTVMTR